MTDVWEQCLQYLQGELPAQEFDNWVRPIQVLQADHRLHILVPNQYTLEQIRDHYFERIQAIIASLTHDQAPNIMLEIGSIHHSTVTLAPTAKQLGSDESDHSDEGPIHYIGEHIHHLNKQFLFRNFIEGKSNQFALAASKQIADNPGKANNPLFIYGGTGLGKTHLMHAIGNHILEQHPDYKIYYLSAERFVRELVNALQHNTIDTFKSYYRSLNTLLIDDIQFLANKDRSQEEFFHTFNALVEEQQQIILSCDRYPKEVEGLEERLRSRFGSGLTVSVEFPDIETRVAILKSKAEQVQVQLSDELAFFIARNVHSNVRELEGALKSIIANAQFKGQPMSVELARESLKDLLVVQHRFLTIEQIQKIVADYYGIEVADFLGHDRSRVFARPRQVAMALTKELTNCSLPDIGKQFGNRDHTTVLHACKKVKEWRERDPQIAEDYLKLMHLLST